MGVKRLVPMISCETFNGVEGLLWTISFKRPRAFCATSLAFAVKDPHLDEKKAECRRSKNRQAEGTLSEYEGESGKSKGQTGGGTYKRGRPTSLESQVPLTAFRALVPSWGCSLESP